jgi:hypothetical protein
VIRCFITSFGLHLSLVVTLLILSVVTPPPKRIETVKIQLLEPQAVEAAPAPQATAVAAPTPRATPRATPRPTPRATPRPTPRPTATPRPTPKQIAAPENVKEIVRENPKIVKPTPTATPRPEPVPKASPAPTPTPRQSPTPRPSVDVPALPKAAPPPKIATDKLSVEQSPSGDTLASLNQTYFLMVLRRLEENFKPPINRAGVTCRVSFRILKDGTLIAPRIVGGTESMGQGLSIYAIQAIEKTGRVPPLYEGIRENYLDVIVTFNFSPKE